MRNITKKNYTMPGEMKEAVDKSRPGKAANLEEESSFQHKNSQDSVADKQARRQVTTAHVFQNTRVY